MIVFYFSGTGNSLWTAKKIARRFSGKVRGIMEFSSKKEIVVDEEKVGFVFPVYMNDLPWVAKAFLMELKLKNPKYVFAVLTSSSGKGRKAVKSLDAGLRANGAKLSAVYHLPMPGNCIPGKETKEKKKLEKAPEHLERIIKDIKRNTENVSRKPTALRADFVTGSWFYKPGFPGAAMKPWTDADQCDGCGLCASVCPTRNIKIKEGKAVHGNCCTACYACFHWCPNQAQKVSMPLISGRKQYHHPEIDQEEIAGQKGAGTA